MAAFDNITSLPDLGLPFEVPLLDRPCDPIPSRAPVLVYTQVDLCPGEIQELLIESHQKYNTKHPKRHSFDIVRRAPLTNFRTDNSLESLWRDHIGDAESNGYSPQFFFVVMSEAWAKEGILFVNLLDDDEFVSFFVLDVANAAYVYHHVSRNKHTWAEAREWFARQLGPIDDGLPIEGEAQDYDGE